MTHADYRRIANAISYFNIDEAESALQALAQKFGEDVREGVISAICDLNTVRAASFGTRTTEKSEAVCPALAKGQGLKLYSYDGGHVMYIAGKEFSSESFGDVWRLVFELRQCATDRGRTHGISRLYPVKSLIPPSSKRKAVNICISANVAV